MEQVERDIMRVLKANGGQWMSDHEISYAIGYDVSPEKVADIGLWWMDSGQPVDVDETFTEQGMTKLRYIGR